MKTKFFFVMSVAATMLLASCGGNNPTPAESSKPADTSTPSETSQVTPRVVSITCDLESNELIVGETLKLRPTVTVEGGASKIVSYKSSDTDIATVTDGGVVEGKNVGKVTITITSAADENVKCEVKLEIVEAPVQEATPIAQLAGDSQNIFVDAVVIAKAYNGFIVADATAAVYVFTKNYEGENGDPEVGAHLKVSGNGSAYYGGVELVPTAIEVAEGEAPTPVAKAAMTEDLGKALLAEVKGSGLDMNKSKVYTFDNVLIGGTTNKFTWEIGEAKFITSNTDASNQPVAGKNYNLEGVPFNSAQTGELTVILTKAEEVQAEAGEVTISGPTSVTVGESIELQGNVEGVDGLVEWSLKEGSAEFASIVANGNKVTVTGEKAGEAVVVATYGDKSAEWKVKVLVPFAAKTLAAAELNDRIIVDGVVVVLSNNGFVVADATGFAYVYTKDFKDAAGQAIPLPEVGAHISMKATVGAFNGAFQLVPTAIEAAEGDAPVAKSAVPMTAEKGLELLTAVKAAKDAKGFVAGVAETVYSFEGVEVTRAGGKSPYYLYWDLGDAHFENANTLTAMLDQLVEAGGKAKLNIEAIPYGFYQQKSGDEVTKEYLTMVITKAEVVVDPATSEETSEVVPVSEETSQEAPVSQESSEVAPVSEESQEQSSEVPAETKYVIDYADTGITWPTAYNEESADSFVTSDGLAFAAKGIKVMDPGDGSVLLEKGKAVVYNERALPGALKEIRISMPDNLAKNFKKIYVTSGTTQYSKEVAESAVANVTGCGKGVTVTYTPTGLADTYFQIANLDGSNNGRFITIEVVYE